VNGRSTTADAVLVSGIQPVFFAIAGKALDPDDAYFGEWIGDGTAPREVLLAGDGRPVIGIESTTGYVQSVSLLLLNVPPTSGSK
jgi:hypothetical protein